MSRAVDLTLFALLVVGLIVLTHYVVPTILIPALERRRRAAGHAPRPPRSRAYRWTFIPVMTVLLVASRLVLAGDLVGQLGAAFASWGVAHYAGRFADRLRLGRG
jgi:hypothetical protein